MEYLDVVHSVNQAYWHTLLSNDAEAKAFAVQVAQQLGMEPQVAQMIVEQFSRQQLQDWVAQRSAAA